MEIQELQLVNFEQAKRLKNLGFDWRVERKWGRWSCVYSGRQGYCIMPLGQMALPNNEVFLAPSVALALKWFRDVKSMPSSVEYFGCDTDKYEAAYYFVEKISKDGFFTEKHRHTIKNKYNQYEEAESALLDEMLSLLKEK